MPIMVIKDVHQTNVVIGTAFAEVVPRIGNDVHAIQRRFGTIRLLGYLEITLRRNREPASS